MIVPATPTGYQPPYSFQYPRWLVLSASFILLLISIPLFSGLAWALQDRPPVFTVSLAMSDLALIVVSVFLTFVIHEFVHGIAYQMLGYRVTYGVALHLGAVYTAVFHQWQQRNHTIAVVIAPLCVLNAIGLCVLPFAPPWLLYMVVTGLIVNTSGAAGDLYMVRRLLRMPPGTMSYDIDTQQSFVYEPLATSRSHA